MEYKQLLILAYFKRNYKKYDFRELMEIMGMSNSYLRKLLTDLFLNQYLLLVDDYIVVSKVGENMLKENILDSFVFGEINIEKRKHMNINDIYIPKDFKL
ncbi:hypothetical protein [Lacrimispora sp.]|uniref:hypothetical protein n=1 Tax=Lacrimispora sp. TaxID=2719234 RepID=UPI0028A94FBB|nr:hypothetical protein [Lacrimispora sp.]